MKILQSRVRRVHTALTLQSIFLLALSFVLPRGLSAQSDPAEPQQGRPSPKLLPRPAKPIIRSEVNEKSMRTLIEQLVGCGTRNSLSSWSDSVRGAGCAREHILARFKEIEKDSGGNLHVVTDSFETKSNRTNDALVPMQNIYAVLAGSDPVLSKTAFLVSGHFDSRASDVMNPNLDAPGADDDASGVAVSLECARLLSRLGAAGRGPFRATLIFAAISGEEQGLLGSARMLEWVKQQGYTVGGMLDNDIVGSDSTPGTPHRVRLFSGSGDQDDSDSSSRELARAIEEIDGRNSLRLIFNIDRLGRGGDHFVFYKDKQPAVRFTEPLEDYHHQHQTPRMENGVEYGDQIKYLNFSFMGNVARSNAEALRQLALAPAAPAQVKLTGGVTPDARLSWNSEADPDREGFEILWRETTDPRWQVYDFSNSAGEYTFKGVSTDNHFFAVRAVGRNGGRSVASSTATGRNLPF